MSIQETLGTIRTDIKTPEIGLDFLGKQTFVVDPRNQGFGLREYGFLDAYANKFFILANSNGVFISPKAIPQQQLDYCAELGLDIPSSDHIFHLEDTQNTSPLTERVKQDNNLQRVLTGGNNYVVPYMMTHEVEVLARQFNLNTLVKADTVTHLADKAHFQELLQGIQAAVLSETGLEIAIKAFKHQTDEREEIERSYVELSENGRNKVVIVRPKSASALGIFIVGPDEGIDGAKKVITQNFEPGEEILLEAFIQHNHSPSFQGIRAPGSEYQHLYFGRQIIAVKDGRIEYEASQIPFQMINQAGLEKMQHVHQLMGSLLLEPHSVSGIAGFDAVVNSQNQDLTSMKLTELNLHLPSSVAVYAAMYKLFPEGFSGIAHNINIPLQGNQAVDEFIRNNRDGLIQKRGNYGMFPLNTSYTDKVDVIFFGKDEEHIQALQANIKI